MAFTKIEKPLPVGSSPGLTTGYVYQNNNLDALTNRNVFLTNNETTSIPQIKLASIVNLQGIFYQVTSSNYTIGGTYSSGVDNYVRVYDNAGTITAEWIQSLTGYAWDSDYGGLYNSGSLILPYVVRDVSSTYYVYAWNSKEYDLLVNSSIQFPDYSSISWDASADNFDINKLTKHKGLVPNGFYEAHDGVGSFAGLYAALSNDIPDVGDEVILNGGYYSYSTTFSVADDFIFSKAVRTSSTQISLYSVRLARQNSPNIAPIVIDATLTTPFTTNQALSVAW